VFASAQPETLVLCARPQLLSTFSHSRRTVAAEQTLNGNALMNTATDWRLESSLLSHQTGSNASDDPMAAPPVRPEVSTMYSPISIAFFGLTGTAVGAAGVTGSFGGLTSLFATVAVLFTLFALFLAARAVARRRLNN
jgi:hypothetical protein